MHSILNQNQFFVKEHTGVFKAANNYDIYDLESREMLMTCREENLGFFTKMFRFTDYKRMTPFEVEIKTTAGDKVLTVKRGTSFWASKVEVFDETDTLIGVFKQKMFSLGGKFDVMDASENVLCTLKGKWTSWDFWFERDGVQFAQVTKKWAGIGKELFTTADNYVLNIEESVAKDSPMRTMIVAAVMCIDMVLKE